MDKLTFEKFCKYADKGVTIVPVTKPLMNKGIPTIMCDSELEREKVQLQLSVFYDCYQAIKDYPNEKGKVMKALRKYERDGIPFVIGYNFWESSEEPPEDFKFINIAY